MTDPKIGVTLTGGQIQGVAGAGNVVIENFTIYNNPAHDVGGAASGDEPIPRCPYPGLAHFGPNDAELFFGRDTAIARLVEAVDRQSFTVLVGASGSGKSSVVLAGLASRLHHAADWRFSHFRIGTELDRNPFLALARALVPLYVDSTSATERLKNTKQLATSIETGELSLRDVFADCRSRNKGRHILLIADQFEEAFSLLQDETVRRRFIDALLAGFLDTARGGRPEISLILTLRGDFYGQALGYRPFADALQGHVENLGPMSREELRAAVVRPAEKTKVSFEGGLVETLLDNLDNAPGSLPLLQFALREMWGRQEKRKITRKSYDDIGGVQAALADRAETIFRALTENDANVEMADTFRRLFTRLVMLGEGQEDTRRIVSRSELGNVVWSLAQRLADEDNRLVVTNAPTFTNETVELVHEALIRHWPRLMGWINSDRVFQSWLRQMKPNIDFWSANPTDEGPLLRGSMLAQATEWLATRLSDLSPSEKRLIEASLALEKRVSGERIFWDTLMRSLDLSEWTDQAKVDLGRMSQLQEFIKLTSANKTNGFSSTRFIHRLPSADNVAEQTLRKQGGTARRNRRYYAALTRLPRGSVNGIWYRPTQLRFISAALSSIHTKKLTSRFNPGVLLEGSKQFESLSFAEDPMTGMFEAGALFGRADLPGAVVPDPRLSITMIAVQVNLQNIMDLFDEENTRLLQTSSQELTGDWSHYTLQKDRARIAPTQMLGEAIFRMNVEGFLAPSTKVPFKRILIVFPENFATGSSLVFQDAAGEQVLSG